MSGRVSGSHSMGLVPQKSNDRQNQSGTGVLLKQARFPVGENNSSNWESAFRERQVGELDPLPLFHVRGRAAGATSSTNNENLSSERRQNEAATSPDGSTSTGNVGLDVAISEYYHDQNNYTKFVFMLSLMVKFGLKIKIETVAHQKNIVVYRGKFRLNSRLKVPNSLALLLEYVTNSTQYDQALQLALKDIAKIEDFNEELKYQFDFILLSLFKVLNVSDNPYKDKILQRYKMEKLKFLEQFADVKEFLMKNLEFINGCWCLREDKSDEFEDILDSANARSSNKIEVEENVLSDGKTPLINLSISDDQYNGYITIVCPIQSIMDANNPSL